MTSNPTAFKQWTAPPPPPQGRIDNVPDGRLIRSVLASEWTRDRLATIAASSPRARQRERGPSELGQECPRRLAYRIAGTPFVNLPDPLLAMFGTGLHLVLAAGLRQLDADATGGRFLIEHPVNYRGIAGHVDLYDRLTRRVIDWKTTSLQRIRRYIGDGPPSYYVIQGHIYAAALMAAGEQVDTVALVFIPRDGALLDIWSWATSPDPAKADAAIDRHDAIAAQLDHGTPADVEARPSNLCGYCPNYRPTATDLTVACPGRTDAP